MKLVIAQQLIDVSTKEISKRDKHAAVAVCDQSGNLVAFSRTDNTDITAITIAQNKAYTSAIRKQKSIVLGDKLRDPALGYKYEYFGDNRLTGFGGGAPIFDHANNFLGSIGISGMPEKEDMEVADKVIDLVLNNI